MRRGIATGAVAALVALAGCGGDDKPKTPDQNVRAALKDENVTVKDTDIRKDPDAKGSTVGVYTTLVSTAAGAEAKGAQACDVALKSDKSFTRVTLYASEGVEMASCFRESAKATGTPKSTNTEEQIRNTLGSFIKKKQIRGFDYKEGSGMVRVDTTLPDSAKNGPVAEGVCLAAYAAPNGVAGVVVRADSGAVIYRCPE